MKISNRVKRNISLGIILVGLACTAARARTVIVSPSSGKAWLELCGIGLLTYYAFDSFRTCHRRINKGELF